MKKRAWHILAYLLLWAASEARAQSTQFSYTVTGGTITIEGYILGFPGADQSGAVVIPSSIDGLPVTGIGADAFAGLGWNLTNVAIPASVTSIGADAFAATALASVMIADSVTNIGRQAFGDCFNLASIKVGAQNPNYSSSNGVLFDKNQTTLIQFPPKVGGAYTIPNSVGAIAEEAFEACATLTSVTIPAGVTNIEEGAFWMCSSLTNIMVDPQNPDYSSLKAVLFDNNQTTLIQFPPAIGGAYIIPHGVSLIGDGAFYYCQSLTNVTIPDGVTNIGDEAFEWCGLTSVTIPDSVTDIGKSAFNSCYLYNGLTIGNGVTNIGEEAFADTWLAGGVTIPDSVICIGDSAFSGDDGVTSVTLGNSVMNIGDQAFTDTALTHVSIPGSVTNIGEAAFDGCWNLSSLAISNSVASIGVAAFDDCGNLAWLTIGNAFTNVEELFQSSSFGGLTNITVAAQNPAYSSLDGVLFDKNQTTLIEFPRGIGGAYSVPDSVATIGDSAFASDGALTSVTIGNGVTNIGNEAFFDCTNLTEIFFKGNAPAVGSYAFYEDNYWPGPLPLFALAYCLPGTTGWGDPTNLSIFVFGLVPVLWNPLIQTSDGSFGVQNNQFGFNITGTTNLPVLVEACADLTNPVWSPLQTITLTNGVAYFSEPLQTNVSGRFYRLGFP
jgi:hypothetical protein